MSPFKHQTTCYIVTICLFMHTISSQVLNEVGRLYIPDVGIDSAETISLAKEQQKLFVTSSDPVGVHVISFNSTDDYSTVNMYHSTFIDFSNVFEDMEISNQTVSDVTSTTYSAKDDMILVAVAPNNYSIEHGWIAFIEPNRPQIVDMIELYGCYLPDMITTTPDGNTILVACEGEPDDNTVQYPEYNPPGSIAIVDILDIDDPVDRYNVSNLGFTDFDVNGSKADLLPNDLYKPHMDKAFSINAEPEYITCQTDNKYCYITLQENNAIAILDMTKREIIGISSLGTNDYSEYGLDASDKDDGINITTYARLYGLRMPDSIDYFQSPGGKHYVFTANEGDSKDFDESRVADLILDPTVFVGVDFETLQSDEVLGRLKVVNQLGSDKMDGIFQELYAFSSRDFTIFEVEHAAETSTMSLVFSSDSDFEEVTADILGTDGFNSEAEVPSFDVRSDDKGPEPEGIATGSCSNGRSYAFVGFERAGGIIVYDITLLSSGIVEYVEYINNRDYNITVGEDERPPEESGDAAPEILKFVDEDVYGVPLLLVTNEVSSSVTMYRIECEELVLEEGRGRELEVWEITLIAIGGVLFGVILIVLAMLMIKKRSENSDKLHGQSSVPLTAVGNGSGPTNQTYSAIQTDDHDNDELR